MKCITDGPVDNQQGQMAVLDEVAKTKDRPNNGLLLTILFRITG